MAGTGGEIARIAALMRARRMDWIVWGAVTIVTALRAYIAASLPMTGDEAYYWEWSRHLAPGYVDHPPAVALTIAAFAWMGRNPLAVRLGFVLCGAGATVCAFAAASRLARDVRAGYVAALALTFTPLLSVAFGTATPDGPYLLAWSAAIYFGIVAFQTLRLRWFVALGLALGGALMSRFFGLALVCGVLVAAGMDERRRLLLGKMALSAGVALLCWTPFLTWNQSHGWASFVFAVATRHAAHVDVLRPLLLLLTCAVAFSPGIFAAMLCVARRPRAALVAWTALPLSIVLLVLAVREPVEVYWFYGPYVSLCIGAGAAFALLPAEPARRWIFVAGVPALALCALIYGATIAPLPIYGALRHAGIRLHDAGPFEVFTYPALARDVRAAVAERGDIAMTDGYGFSSVLDFYGDLPPVVIGYSVQGHESQNWYPTSARPKRALFVDKVPFASRSDFVKQFARGCARVRPSRPLVYGERTFYTTWCEGMRPDSLRTLRWGGRR